MKKNVMKMVAVVMAVGAILTGCGSNKPSGTYAYDGVSFRFGKDTVMVSEGSANVVCDYEIDKGGMITFELEGDMMNCIYDDEHDIIIFYGDYYYKE